MTSEEKINLAVSRIADSANPKKAILFGSHARGEATDDSDIDLLVIEERVENRHAEMARLRRMVGDVDSGVDALVYTEEEFMKKSQLLNTTIYWAAQEGKVVYEQA